MINYDFIYYRMLYLCRICALPTLLNTVVLLFNLVKRGIDFYMEIQKLAIFLLQNGWSTYTRCRLIYGKIRYILL